MPHIRIASRSDAIAVATLAEKTFRESFAAENTVEDMDAHCRTYYGEAFQAAEITNPDYQTLVVENNDQLIAYAQLRWQDSPSCVDAKSPGEIQRIYVDHAWHGKGVAHELIQACFDELQKRQSDMAWLGVWEHNPKAISFYQKCGFEPVGEHEFVVGNDPQRDIIMALIIEN